MENYLNLLSILILVSAFVLVANKRIDSYINTFRIQSLLLAVIAGLLGVHNLLVEGSFDILIVCLITIAVKVIYIPHLLKNTVKKVEYIVEKDFFLNIPISVLICCGLVVLTYFAVSTIQGIKDAVCKDIPGKFHFGIINRPFLYDKQEKGHWPDYRLSCY